MKYFIAGISFCLFNLAFASEPSQKNFDKVSYAMGYVLAKQIADDKNINYQALQQGMKDGLAPSAQVKMTLPEARRLLVSAIK